MYAHSSLRENCFALINARTPPPWRTGINLTRAWLPFSMNGVRSPAANKNHRTSNENQTFACHALVFFAVGSVVGANRGRSHKKGHRRARRNRQDQGGAIGADHRASRV